MKARQGSGAPTFCWQCNRQLHRAPGKGLGLFFFELVLGTDGHQHRIHQDCLPDAKADGHKHIKEQP